MASNLRRYSAAFEGQQYEAMESLAGEIERIQKVLGISSSTSPTQVPTPTAASFTVIGVDGKFLVSITNPANIQAATVNQLLKNTATNSGVLYHQLQSATDVNFNVNSNVTTFGPTNQLSLEVQDPNQVKFWRLRSSYDQATWNDWQYFIDPALCGPVALWSGLLRNSSEVLNNAASTPAGTNPLTQSGTSKTINVASSVWKCGNQTINYNSGSVTPASYGTWLVYASDQYRKGGTVTFLATQSSADITSSDYYIYFGAITTASGGGGTGSGGGGGTCCRAGVPYKKYDGTDADCSTLKVDDILMAADGGPEVIQQIDVIPQRPCFHLEFDNTGKLTKKEYIGDFTVYRVHLDRSHTFLAGANNVIDGACSEHTIQYSGGGFTNVFAAVVGEPFNVVNGAVSSHNYNKL